MALFHVINLGCKVNKVESDHFATQLLAQGLQRGELNAADVVIINTCAVTGDAEKKTRKTVRHACSENAVAPIYVTGCSANLHPDVYRAMSTRVVVAPKNSLMERLQSEQPALFVGDLRGLACGEQSRIVPAGEGFRTRVGIKIQDGCDNACTYCIVHVARGHSWSRPFSEIVDEACAYVQAGIREIVLTGIDLGCYNDPAGRGNLVDLLRALLEAAGEYAGADSFVRFRISSIEPKNVTDDLLKLMASSDGRICRHFHLPLQSGSSKVLDQMARPYTAEEYVALVGRARELMPELALSTDIIVGFPGETDEDFQETCAVARACAFSRIHVFPYSPREGTPAAERTDQVPPEVKRARADALRMLSKELVAADLQRRLGTHELALVEQKGVVMTESYHRLTCVNMQDKVGELIDFQICPTHLPAAE